MSVWPLLSRAEFRQRGHHRAFRIAEARADESPRQLAAQLLAEVRALAERVEQQRSSEPKRDEAASRQIELAGKDLADVATDIWRARRKLAQDGDEISRYARHADRYLNTCQDKLAKLGLVVQDHDDDRFHPGRALEVISYEEDASCDFERVLYTVRPSVYFQGRLIQMGQVVVGVPPAEGASGVAGDELRGAHG